MTMNDELIGLGVLGGLLALVVVLPKPDVQASGDASGSILDDVTDVYRLREALLDLRERARGYDIARRDIVDAAIRTCYSGDLERCAFEVNSLDAYNEPLTIAREVLARLRSK